MLGACLAGLGLGVFASADDPPAGSSATTGRELPTPFASFEYLIGRWKGAGIPAANKTRGWEETHAWAWKFEKGTPIGLSVTMTGGKVLAKALFTFDTSKKKYIIIGYDPVGKPLTFVGGPDKTGKGLILDRIGATSAGAKQRITLYPNANFIRYTLKFDEQETGAPQYKALIAAGMTKEGESFAAGSTTGADLPKCIVTGGAATISVNYQGVSYPLCCTGCRDEFNENPAKYIKKLALQRESGAQTGAKTKTAPIAKDDGAFDGLVDSKPAARSSSGSMKKAAAATTGGPAGAADPKRKAASKGSDVSRAASSLRLGQNLEKAGKTAGALDYYRRVVKDFPDTPSAKTAAARIKALADN